MNRPTIFRFALSCSNVNFIPPELSPPQPKHLFVGFGSSLTVSLNLVLAPFPYSLLPCFVTSHQGNAAPLRSPHAALPFAHLHFQHFRQRGHATSDLLFVKAGECKSQRIRQRALHIEVAPRRKQHAVLFYVNQQLARI